MPKGKCKFGSELEIKFPCLKAGINEKEAESDPPKRGQVEQFAPSPCYTGAPDRPHFIPNIYYYLADFVTGSAVA
jgi:hypothetical protein